MWRSWYWSTGYKRFEFSVGGMDIALPFSITLGHGAYSLNFLIFEFTWWRHGFRYEDR
jgi:hypothetical protein